MKITKIQLTGSEKQITWAQDIVAEKIAGLQAELDEAMEGAGTEEKAYIEGQVKYFNILLDNMTDASIWISHRGYDIMDILETVAMRVVPREIHEIAKKELAQ